MLKEFSVPIKANFDAVDITSEVQALVQDSGFDEGLVAIFVPGSTGAVTTIEYESGVIKDLERAIEKIAPQNENYEHNKKWHDGNGFSHVRAALMKPSLVIPFESDRLILGTWQQIVVLDFDNRDRERKIIIKLLNG